MIEKPDVEFMLSEGIRPYLKYRFETINAPLVFHNLYVGIKTILISFAKVATTFIILSKVYERIGLDKFLILLLSGYIAINYVKTINGGDKNFEHIKN